MQFAAAPEPADLIAAVHEFTRNPDNSYKCAPCPNNDRNRTMRIYDQQFLAAEEVIANWVAARRGAGGGRWVVLCAQMQSGKSGVMRQLAYLLTNSDTADALRAELGFPSWNDANDVTWVLSHIADTELLEQTKKNLRDIIYEPDDRIFHSPSMAKSLPDQLTSCAVLLDECHWGTSEGGRIDNKLSAAGLSLKANPVEMGTQNQFVCAISATPFAQQAPGGNLHRVFVKMQPGPDYYGLGQMLANGKVVDMGESHLFGNAAEGGVQNDPPQDAVNHFIDSIFVPALTEKRYINREPGANAVLALGQRLQNVALDHIGGIVQDYLSVQKGFLIIRAIGNKKMQPWKEALVDRLRARDFKVMDYEAGNKNDLLEDFKDICSEEHHKRLEKCGKKGINQILHLEPEENTAIFIKGMLRAGVQLNTEYVGAIVEPGGFWEDSKCDPLVDTVAQGLVGRCCGYQKAVQHVRIIANRRKVLDYSKFWINEAIPLTASGVSGGHTRWTSAYKNSP